MFAVPLVIFVCSEGARTALSDCIVFLILYIAEISVRAIAQALMQNAAQISLQASFSKAPVACAVEPPAEFAREAPPKR